MKIYVKDIIEKCDGKLIIGNKDLELINFSKDTRTINQEDIYVAMEQALAFYLNLMKQLLIKKNIKIKQ